MMIQIPAVFISLVILVFLTLSFPICLSNFFFFFSEQKEEWKEHFAATLSAKVIFLLLLFIGY